MKGFAAKILLSCKKASELVEKKQDKKISIVESLQLKLHLWICTACAIYEKQSKALETLLRKISSTPKIEKLSEESKQNIFKKLEE